MAAPVLSPSPAHRIRDRRWIAFVFLAAVLPYLGTLRADFTNWDDPGYVTENPGIRGFSKEHVTAWISQDYFANRAPVHLASYAADYTIWGMRPFGYHLTNLLLHGLAAALLWLFLRRLGGARWVTTAGVLLFALHPAGVEVVAWVAERKTLLAACFMLGSALCFLRTEGRRAAAWAGLSVTLFALGMMSKVAIAPFPFLLLVLQRGVGLPWNRARVALISLCFLLALWGGVITVRIQTSLEAAGRLFGGTAALHAQVLAVSFLHYLAKLLFPVRLSPYYDLRAEDLTTAGVVLGGAALVLAAVACLVMLTRRMAGGYLAAGAFLMWLPSSSVLVPISTPMADRYLYLPLLFLGPLMAIIVAGAAGTRARRALGAAMAGVAVLFGLLTASQASHWHSSRRLWERAVEVQPDNPYSRQKLAYTLWAGGDAAAALPHAKRAVAVETRWFEGLETLGRVALDAGDPVTAEGAFRQQLGLAPNAVNAHLGVARARAAQDDDRGALDGYLATLRLKRDHEQAAIELGELAARNHWEEETLAKLPEEPTSAWIDLVRGDLLARLGRRAEAEALWRRILAARPDFSPALERLGRAGGRAGRRAGGTARLTDPEGSE
ncbi:MAG: hypothetical protein Q8R92_04105 [Deltaproteobacteria bacterium]|nr:hypothetical protein [Deltaproteobacteria bacterium]